METPLDYDDKSYWMSKPASSSAAGADEEGAGEEQHVREAEEGNSIKGKEHLYDDDDDDDGDHGSEINFTSDEEDEDGGGGKKTSLSKKRKYRQGKELGVNIWWVTDYIGTH